MAIGNEIIFYETFTLREKSMFWTWAFLKIILSLSVSVQAQGFNRKYSIEKGGLVEIKNLYGRLEIQTEDKAKNNVLVAIRSSGDFSENDLRVKSSKSKLKLEVVPQSSKVRVDIDVKLPARSRIRLQSANGAIHVIGDFAEAKVFSETGTIYADVSLKNVKYKFSWIGSKPRFISEVDLAEVKEKAAGRFEVKGALHEKDEAFDKNKQVKGFGSFKANEEKEKAGELIKLDFITTRGIVLLNVSPDKVPSILRERPLTRAAKTIVQSGDSLLVNAIQRASPKHFGKYASTLPNQMKTPFLEKNFKRNNFINSKIKRVTAQIMDMNNRAIFGLGKQDFLLTEHGEEREILSIKKTIAPFNLVLLLDVSGSIEHYVDFIRKAARDFINKTSPQDKIAIVVFNDDVRTISTLTGDRNALSESLDAFDAGGGTAYYDALAYTLIETLKPLEDDRTAIVVLSDGDDNSSFLPFESLLGAIQESGALIYTLYVPSGLITESSTVNPNNTVDPLRTRFMSLTSKAQKEGEMLAKVSGGVYYPISRLSELQKAYEDIVLQLRTAYTITYRSDAIESNMNRVSPRLKIRVKRDNAFVKLGSIVAVDEIDFSIVEDN